MEGGWNREVPYRTIPDGNYQPEPGQPRPDPLSCLFLFLNAADAPLHFRASLVPSCLPPFCLSDILSLHYYGLILLLTLPSKVGNQCLSFSIEPGVKLTSRLPTRPLTHTLSLSHPINIYSYPYPLVPLFSFSFFPSFPFTFPHTVFVLQAGLCSFTDYYYYYYYYNNYHHYYYYPNVVCRCGWFKSTFPSTTTVWIWICTSHTRFPIPPSLLQLAGGYSASLPRNHYHHRHLDSDQ